MQKIICLDFDGVIHSYTSKFTTHDVIADGPVPGALRAILGYLGAGYDVAILSSRSNYRSGRKAMQQWLIFHLRKNFHHIDPEYIVHQQILWPISKPPAIITIDDRAVTFKGTFPTIEEIQSFKPWNK